MALRLYISDCIGEVSYKTFQPVPTKGDIFSNLHIANPNGFHLLIIDIQPLKFSDITSIAGTGKGRRYKEGRRKNNNTL